MTGKTKTTGPGDVAGVKTAQKTAAAPAVKTEAQKTAEAFDWNDLAEAQVPEYTRPSSRRIENVAESTPPAIIARIKESFDAYRGPGHDPDHPKKTVLSWRTQECGTPERATEFLRLARRYAENIEPRITLRATIDEKNAPTVVRFMAKTFEARDRAA